MMIRKIMIAAIWTTLASAVAAQTGGYPASPSHGIVGPPKPDGTPRYGHEPGRTVGSPSDSAAGDRSHNADRSGKNGGSAVTDGRADESAGRR
jgi:hypothetical protein